MPSNLYYHLERPRRNGIDAIEWKPDDASEPLANINRWYAEGRLLFPREELQHFRDQLRKPLANGDLIYLKAFDGSIYDYVVQTGNPKPEIDGDNKLREWVMTAPQIHYNSFEGLKRQLDWSLSRAYCSIGLAHLMVRVDEEPELVDGTETSLGLFNDTLRAWEQNEAWKEIKSTLLSLYLRFKVHKIVGMACGDFASPDLRLCRRSITQHALLLSLKNTLQGSHIGAADVACYVQDPVYSKTDRSVLESLGMHVVEDPDGFLEMDDRTLVFSCSPNICVKEIIADIVRPLIMILNTVKEDKSNYPSTDPNSPRVKQMVKDDYDAFSFPENDNFNDMTIYVKKQTHNPQED